MRRRRTKGEDVGVTLFPFLAVLLCTMGTLIVLLLVITERAQHTTDEPPPPQAPVVARAPSVEDDPTTWRKRSEQIAATREQVTAIVQDRRARLGFLEKTTRDLENQIVELKARLEEQKRLAQADDEQVAKAEAEVKRLEDRAEQAAENLEAIRRENTNRPASFSIVPYDGPNSTPRRPVYIECRGNEVILQPEGVILSPDDFVLASDAGNPLATVLRATREYLVTNQSLGEQQEPYPLIVVRPDGVEAYYAVRQSLQGWTTDFGYELVQPDWTLKFPPPDPNLASTQFRALAEARLRQKALVAMLERKAKKNPSYRPADRAGIVREGDDHGFGAASIPYHGEEVGAPGDALAGNPASGRGGNGADAGADGDTNNAGTGDTGTGDTGTGHSAANGTGFEGTGNGTFGSPGTFAGNLSGSAGQGHASHGGRLDGTPDGAGGNSATRDPGSANGNGSSAAGGRGDQPFGDPRESSAAGTSGPLRPGQLGARSPTVASNAGRGAASAPGDASGDGTGSAGSGVAGGPAGDASGSSFSSGAPDTSIRKDAAKVDPESLANRRGRDWGLRYAAPTATPVTRPLRVVCYSDRILVLTDDAKRAPKQIVLKPQTRDSADEFVAAVWDEIKAWGIAGKGMYWRPILSFDVHAGGDRRYEEFARLLDGSGFEVRRRETAVAGPAPVANPPRPQR